MSKIFECEGGCGRTLPLFLKAEEPGICGDCSADSSVEELKNDLPNDGGSSRTPSSSYSKDEKSGTADNSNVQSNPEASLDPKVQFYLKREPPAEADTFPELDLFAFGEYDSGDGNDDEYSEQLIEFAKREDMSHLPEFEEQFESFFDLRVDPDTRPDSITIYPGHTGTVSPALSALAKTIAEDRNIEYKQYLERRETTPQQREQDYEDRFQNQKGTVTVNDQIPAETIYLLDDVVTSGSSMIVGAKALLDAGAEQVIGISLGYSKKQFQLRINRLKDESHTVSSVLQEESHE